MARLSAKGQEIMEQKTLIHSVENGVLWLTLNRPDSLNALSKDLVNELMTAFTELNTNTAIRVVVLKANGRAFCAGLDLTDGGWGAGATPQQLLTIQRSISDVYRAMRRCPQPIIALVQGAACGGGFSLALASDIRIAADNAKMNAAFIKAGLSACDMGCSYFLPRLVGVSIASELMLTGRFINAERALRTHLVSEVVPESNLVDAAKTYITEMQGTSPLGLRLTKDGLNFSTDAPTLDAAMALEDRQQTILAMTSDAREAINAFLEKRAPDWSDS